MRGNIAKNATVEEEWGGHSGAKLDVRERVESGMEWFAVSCESTTPSNETPKNFGCLYLHQSVQCFTPLRSSCTCRSTLHCLLTLTKSDQIE